MPSIAATLFMILLGSSPVFAQAFGSVHCKAALRQIEIDQVAAQRKVDSTKDADGAQQCRALQVNVLTLEHAGEVYGRCTAGTDRDEKLGRVNASAAGSRDTMVVQNCGG